MVYINETEVEDMRKAKEVLEDIFTDEIWDIWLEETSYGSVIFIEDEYNADENSVALVSLEEVKKFCDNGGFN